MEIRQLRYFLSVIKLGSVGAAAKEHFITQPAVSIQLKKLEDELGEKLITRRDRKIVATPTGNLLLDKAEDVVKRIASMESSIEELKKCRRGCLKMGTIDAASVYVLPKIFRLFRKRYPGIDINVEVSDSSRLIGDLLSGKIELAIITLPLEEEGLEIIPIYKDKMVLVASPKHPLAQTRRSALKAVAEMGLITYPVSSTTRKIIEDVFAQSGLTLRAAMEVSSPEAIKRLTEAGLGASILPLPVVAGEIRRGTLKVIPGGKGVFCRILGVVFKKPEILSPPARMFVEMLQDKLTKKR